MVMRRFAALLLVFLLSGCSALQGTPQPAPPVADHPQEIRRNQTEGLQRMAPSPRWFAALRMTQNRQ